MATPHFHPLPAKRVKVKADTHSHPTWALVPASARTVKDLLHALLLSLKLRSPSSYDVWLDGCLVLPDQDIAIIRDGENLHLRVRPSSGSVPTALPTSSEPDMSATSTLPHMPRGIQKKRKRVLTAEGKRRRNARNRKREKRRKLESRAPQLEDAAVTPPSPLDSPPPLNQQPPGSTLPQESQAQPREAEQPTCGRQSLFSLTSPLLKDPTTQVLSRRSGSGELAEDDLREAQPSQCAPILEAPQNPNMKKNLNFSDSEHAEPTEGAAAQMMGHVSPQPNDVPSPVPDSVEQRNVLEQPSNEMSLQPDDLTGMYICQRNNAGHNTVPEKPIPSMPIQTLDVFKVGCTPLKISGMTEEVTVTAYAATTHELHENLQNAKSNNSIGPFVNVNPRWKQRHASKSENSGSLPRSCTPPTKDDPEVEDIDPTNTEDPSHGVPLLESSERDEQSQGLHAHQGLELEVSPPLNTSEVISPVDSIGGDRLSRENTMKESLAAEGRSSSVSPESVVVSLHDSQKNGSVAHKMKEKSKKKSSNAQIQPDTSIEKEDKQDKSENSHQANLPFVGGTGRKSSKPKRLSKPILQTYQASDAPANCVQVSDLEKLKEEATRGLRMGAERDREKDVENCGESDLDRHNSSARGADEGGKNSIRLNTLKGGLTTLQALRIARARTAEVTGTCSKKGDAESQDGSTRVAENPGAFTAAGPIGHDVTLAKDTTRKKKKRTRRSRKVQDRYVNEEQVNKSAMVGYGSRSEILLPPPDLLDFPEGADNLVFGDNQPVKTAKSSPTHHQIGDIGLGPRKDTRPFSLVTQPRNCFARNQATTSAAAMIHNQDQDPSFDAPRDEVTVRIDAGHLEKNSLTSIPDASHHDSISKTMGGSLDRTEQRGSRCQRDSQRIVSLNNDTFREDLVSVLQHTAITLAGVWSNWEAM